MDSQIKMIQIQTTSYCPGRCIMCPYKDSWLRDAHGYMSDDDFIHILEEIKSYLGNYREKLPLYLMNDPLTDKKLIERIHLVYQYFPRCKLELSTNGLLLTKKVSQALVDALSQCESKDEFEFWISLHGVNKQTWEFLNGLYGKYEKTITNIINFLRINNGRLKVFINSVGGASRDGSMFFYSKERWERFVQGLLNVNKVPMKNVYLRYFTFHNRAGNVRLGHWDGREFYRDIGPEFPLDCWRFRGGIHILYNLDVIACCMDYNREVVFGNLKSQTLKEIWEGEKRRVFVDTASGRRPSPKDFICKRCMSPGG